MEPINENLDDEIRQIMLRPRQGSLRIGTQDMCNMLTLVCFLFQIRATNMSSPQHNALCRLKMFGMWIWRGEISLDANLLPLVRMWEKARKLMHGPWGLRIIHHGRTIVPDVRLRDYCHESDLALPIMNLFLQNGQHGGGPVDLKPATPRQVMARQPAPPPRPTPISVDTQNLQELEQENFSNTQDAFFKQWQRMPDQLREFDIREFSSLRFVMDDGMMHFEGDLKKLITFSKYLKHSGIELILFQAGWLITLQFVEYGDPPVAKLLFVPRPSCTGASRAFVRSLLHMCLASMDFPRTVPKSEEACYIRVKLWSTIIFEGFLPRNTMSQELFDAQSRAGDLLGYTGAMRLIARGKQISQEFPIRHYIHKDVDTTTTFHFVLQLRGGGGVKPVPVWEAKHAIATVFVAAGATLKAIDTFCDEMVHIAGPNSIMDCCKSASMTAKLANLKKLASRLQVKIPETSQQATQLQQKVREKLKHEASRYDPQELPRQLQIQEGFFCNDDGTACKQQPVVQPNISGVVLLSWEEAKPWLQPPQKLSADEFGIIVVGQCACDKSSACRKLTIPVFSAPDNPLIIQGTLHQLGGKDIKVKDDQNTLVPVAQSTIMCVTAFRDEVGENMWPEVVHAPIKWCIANLNTGDTPIQLTSPPWGRSFQKDKTKVSADVATSFQFHCRIPSSEVKKTLRASGFGGLYTTVKSEDRKVSQDYNVIWLPSTTVELQKLMVVHVEHRGIVRSAKAFASGRGLRFEKADFSAAWSKLKPNDEEPLQILSKHLFKITPTPVGAQIAEIQKFLQGVKWKAKPIRALSSNTWLCTAEEKYSDTFLTWNNTTILVRWLNEKPKGNNIILAGQAPKKMKQQEKTASSEAAVAPPVDAWAQYRATHGNHFQANGNGLAAQNQQARSIDAPMESRFKAQDEAMEQLKQQSAEKFTKMQADMQQLQSAIQQTNSTMNANQQQNQTDFAALRKETAMQFTTMQNSFNASLTNSLQTHEKHVGRQFDEIKQLLLQQHSDLGTPRKQAKVEHPGNDAHDL